MLDPCLPSEQECYQRLFDGATSLTLLSTVFHERQRESLAGDVIPPFVSDVRWYVTLVPVCYQAGVQVAFADLRADLIIGAVERAGPLVDFAVVVVPLCPKPSISLSLEVCLWYVVASRGPYLMERATRSRTPWRQQRYIGTRPTRLLWLQPYISIYWLCLYMHTHTPLP